MTRAGRPTQSMSTSRQTRRHEYGRPASPVKAGLRPPPSAANGLDRACCPALVGHQAFNGVFRLTQVSNHSSTPHGGHLRAKHLTFQMTQQDHLGEAMTRKLGTLPSEAIRCLTLIVAR